MSDSVPDGDQQQSPQTEMKERAELISVVLMTVLEEVGYASAVDQARKLFAHTTSAQMEQMKPHFSSLALEFMILAGFFKD
jgi:trimethylamine:corrinoid methyltransferase-like protein